MKRIIICADGTWNVRDQVDDKTKKRHPSNVTKVARAIRSRDSKGVDQVVYYHDGVGTAGGLDRFTGGAFGQGIEANIRDLYRFILYNHESDDELYFFGFSRGAFTVRTLAGFMKFVGMIEKDCDYFVPDLFECYEKRKGEGTPEWDHAHRHIKREDKSPCPVIRFIGVWDTVGALGAPGFLGQWFNKDKYEYHDVSLHPEIEHAYHALAIDERRKPFMPNIWKRPAGWSGVLEQVWFAGVHSNIGGGYDPDGLANEALHWIVEKAEGLGLAFDERFLTHFRPCFDSVLQNSMSATYKLLGPHVRPIGEHRDDGEGLHKSAMDRLKHAASDYHPENLERFLQSNSAPSLATTTRVASGVPCGKLVSR